MATRDLHDNIKVSEVFASTNLTATKTDGEIIDTAGYESLEFIVDVSAATTADASNYFVFSLQEGDNSALSDAAAVSSDDILGTAPTIDATTETGIYKFGYRGGKRYVRLIATETGTADITATAIAVQGHPRHAPVA